MKRRLSGTETTVAMDSGLATEPVIGPAQAGRTRWSRPGMTELLSCQLLVLRLGALGGRTRGNARHVGGKLRPLGDHLEHHAETNVRADHHVGGGELLAHQPR